MTTPRGGTEPITGLLRAWSGGDAAALDRLTPLLHGELKRVARRYLGRERAGHTLQPTALVNELFLKLIEAQGIEWHDREHFFALCARVMRHILINQAASRSAGKRGGSAEHVALDEGHAIASGERAAELVVLDGVLERLAAFDQRKARVVELRFFGGFTVEETAAALGISKQTVLRDWSIAKAWLAREMDGGGRGIRR